MLQLIPVYFAWITSQNEKDHGQLLMESALQSSATEPYDS